MQIAASCCPVAGVDRPRDISLIPFFPFRHSILGLEAISLLTVSSRPANGLRRALPHSSRCCRHSVYVAVGSQSGMVPLLQHSFRDSWLSRTCSRAEWISPVFKHKVESAVWDEQEGMWSMKGSNHSNIPGEAWQAKAHVCVAELPGGRRPHRVPTHK